MVFDGAKYVKSMLSKYKTILEDEANRDYLDDYIGYGRVDTATFLQFVRACTGKLPRRKGQTQKKSQAQYRRAQSPSSESAQSSSDEELANGDASDWDQCDEQLSENNDKAERDEETGYALADEECDELLSENDDKVEKDEGTGFASADELESESEKNSQNLCCFCDEPLPSLPSPQLTSLLSKLKQLPGYPDRLSFQTFIDYCARHRFEVNEIPKAIDAGWCMDVNFHELSSRIEEHKDAFEELLNDPEGSHFFELALESRRKIKSHINRAYESFDEQGCG
jgi:hypothetical protein